MFVVTLKKHTHALLVMCRSLAGELVPMMCRHSQNMRFSRRTLEQKLDPMQSLVFCGSNRHADWDMNQPFKEDPRYQPAIRLNGSCKQITAGPLLQTGWWIAKERNLGGSIHRIKVDSKTKIQTCKVDVHFPKGYSTPKMDLFLGWPPVNLKGVTFSGLV